MKTGFLQPTVPGPEPAPGGDAPAAIVEWADLAPTPGAAGHADGEQLLARARAFAEPLLSHQRFDTG